MFLRTVYSYSARIYPCNQDASYKHMFYYVFRKITILDCIEKCVKRGRF